MAMAQCGGGIPGGGNPSCVPPDVFYNSLPPGSAPAPVLVWEERWGAVAMDYDKGVLGAAAGVRTQQQAIKKAVKRCIRAGGSPGPCEANVGRYSNQCAVVAIGGGKMHFNAGVDKIRLGLDTLWDCELAVGQKCKLALDECSLPESVRIQ
jgi:hypothetical protein